MTRIAKREKLKAIVKMKPGKKPPDDYERMFIGHREAIGKIVAGDLYTIEAHEEDLGELGKDPDVISLEYARPTQQLVKKGPGVFSRS